MTWRLQHIDRADVSKGNAAAHIIRPEGIVSITAKELAQELGLSPAAVSMALNGKPGVSDETRRRVLDAAAERGYDMTRITGRQKAKKEIYFLVYKKHGVVVTDTAFFSELFEGIGDGCREAGYRLTIRYLYDDGDTMERQLQELRMSDCSGMILLGTELTQERYASFTGLRMPVVLLDTYYPGTTADYVLINNMQGAYLATDYLIKRTRQQPGYLRSSYPIGNFNERANGFYDAIRAAGMSSSRSIVHRLSPSVEGAFSDMMALLEAGEETAACYFADNDLIAVGAMRALRAKGYRIPEDISIVGFDNIPYANVVEPPLTTIHVPKQEMGRTAVRRLTEILERGESLPMKIEVATRLIKRRSA